MKKLLVIAIFAFVSSQIFSQNNTIINHTIIFEGYLFSEDSIPMENAHIINYRTAGIVVSSKTGYFRFEVEEGDSLMINHISLTPTVIHANDNYKEENNYYIPYKLYTISVCLAERSDHKAEMANFNNNIAKVYKSLEREGFKHTDPHSQGQLPVNMGMGNNVSLNLLTIKDLIKQGRRNKYISFDDESL